MTRIKSIAMIGLVALVTLAWNTGLAAEEPVDKKGEPSIVFRLNSTALEVLKATANEQGVSITEALAPIVAALEKNVTPEGVPLDWALPVFLEVLRFHAQVKGVPVAEVLPAALDALKEYAQAEETTIAQMLKMGMTIAKMEDAQSPFSDEEEYEEEEDGGGDVNCWYECFNGNAALCCDLDGVFQGCGGTTIPCGDGGGGGSDEGFESP
jgi:hypothetical protein